MLMRCMTSSALIYTTQKVNQIHKKKGVTGALSTTVHIFFKVK